MKLKSIAAVTLAVSATFLGGCATVSSPVGGLLYTQVQGPITVGNSVQTGKTGQTCAHSILGLLGFGDASIDSAKRVGGITKVASVDHSSTSILGVYGEYCTVVRGE